MFTITTDKLMTSITYKMLKFTGGEIHVALQPPDTCPNQMIQPEVTYTICAYITDSDDIMELLMLVDAMRRAGAKHLKLFCPYVPYARQDRVMNPGETLGIKVFTDLINQCNFEQVEVWDVHSDVTTALLNNVVNIPQEAFLEALPKKALANTILVAPDAGANKKTLKVAQALGLEMVRADKVRDTKTGAITDTVVYCDNVGDKNFLIVDDICDGGRTFIELAKKLRPLTTGKIYLYVTHGIFSKGLDVFDEIDHIFCPVPFPDVDKKNPKLTVFFQTFKA